MDTTRRSFLASVLSTASRALVAVSGLSLFSACPVPKYGGPPPEQITTKYGGPSTQPQKTEPRRPPEASKDREGKPPAGDAAKHKTEN